MKMKKQAYTVLLAVSLMLASCHRNYKVVYAMPTVDTLAHDDVEKVNDNQQQLLNEPLLEIPDAPQESDYSHVSSKDRADYERYMSGTME